LNSHETGSTRRAGSQYFGGPEGAPIDATTAARSGFEASLFDLAQSNWVVVAHILTPLNVETNVYAEERFLFCARSRGAGKLKHSAAWGALGL
jgi:hypothetical protein